MATNPSMIDWDVAVKVAAKMAGALRRQDELQALRQRVAELTGGQSLAANIQLVLNNARLAAQVAVAFAAG